MSSSIHNPAILLKRVLNLTESSSFILCLDTLAQTSAGVISEIVHHRCGSNVVDGKDSNIIYVSFNSSSNKPSWATHFVDVHEQGGIKKVADLIHSFLPSPQDQTSMRKLKKALIIVDSLNHLPRTQLSQFIGSLAHPHATIVATYHKDMPESLAASHGQTQMDNYPQALDLLQFMATTVLTIQPLLPTSVDDINELQDKLDILDLPRGLNNNRFELNLVNRRKSGRSLTFDFIVDTKTHDYELFVKNKVEEAELETPEMLQGLTTFNLSTSDKQKQAKEQVNLPFLEAQQIGSANGIGGSMAIVYEYEKDDDYDEEDPYEDPF